MQLNERLEMKLLLDIGTVLYAELIKCTSLHIGSLADLNIGHCVELTFGGKRGRFFVVKV